MFVKPLFILYYYSRHFRDNIKGRRECYYHVCHKTSDKILIKCFITEPPDIPEKIIVEVTGNDNVKISCIEADNPESAICTKFNSKQHFHINNEVIR